MADSTASTAVASKLGSDRSKLIIGLLIANLLLCMVILIILLAGDDEKTATPASPGTPDAESKRLPQEAIDTLKSTFPCTDRGSKCKILDAQLAERTSIDTAVTYDEIWCVVHSYAYEGDRRVGTRLLTRQGVAWGSIGPPASLDYDEETATRKIGCDNYEVDHGSAD